ncbi:MAG TPA: sulfurtransferase [Mycobacteriales bacterium]|jgi:Rhodanese-related sulfurtransferase
MTNPLVAVHELHAAQETGEPITLIDVRWTPHGPTSIERFRAGHLPTAVPADLDTDLAAPAGRGGRHPLPDPTAFQAAMRRSGVRQDCPVVVYDQRDSTVCARLWWMLRYFGHRDVRVLDGGLDAWAGAGLPIETGDPKPVEPGDLTVVPGAMPMVTVEQVPEVARHGVLLDARAAERYRGEVEPLDPVAGHIPGALCAPTSDNNGADGRLLPPSELRARFAGLGITDGTTVAAYCGSGVSAAHQVLALWLAGVEAALYVGSWSDWITDPTRPVARGAA